MPARRSHSFTCHPLTNHTCVYYPAAEHHCRLAGTHCAYPQRDGQAELTWLYTEIGFLRRELNPGPVTYPITNRTRCRVTQMFGWTRYTNTEKPKNKWTSISYGDRSFSVCGPPTWNSLPAALCSTDVSVETFRTQLKTFLFRQ